jgi:hypothetical protein
MAIPPKDPAANSNLCETGNARNDAFSQPITNFENHSDVMDTSGTIPADSPRTGRHRRAANPPLPSNVEIIDLDFLPEPKPFIKSEDDDCVFIKSEFTDDSIAKGAIKWPNTEDNPIILDDDEAPPPAPPPAPILRPPFKETKGNASPHLNDMPMADQLVQGVPTPREKPAVPRAGDEMEVKSAASSSHAQSLGQAPAATIASTNSGTLDLGTSTLTPRGRIMGAGLRDKLRKIQQKSKANLQEKRNQPTSGGRPSSAPRAPAAPSTPPVLAISTPTAGPSIPSAAPVAQPFENEVSFNDIVAEHAMLDDQIQDPLEREFPNDYLDAVQRFKEEKKEYEKRRAAVKSDLEDEIQIMQQQSKMDNWRKRLMEDRQHDNPPEHDSLFMPGEFHGPFAEYGDEMSDRDDFQSGPGQLLEAELQAKPRGRPKGSSSKKDTSAKSKSSKPSKGKTGNDKVKDKNAKVSKKAAKSKGKGGPRNKGPSMFDYGSLFTGNVIRDAQGNQGRAQLPLMSSTRKADALKALVASVPQEHRKMAQVDRNYLDSACKDFVGRMSVRAHPGSDGWVVTGMTCILKHHQLLGMTLLD